MAAVCQPRRALAEIPAPQPKIAGEFLALHLTCVTCCLERGATLLELSRRSRPLHVDNSAKFEKTKKTIKSISGSFVSCCECKIMLNILTMQLLKILNSLQLE